MKITKLNKNLLRLFVLFPVFSGAIPCIISSLNNILALEEKYSKAVTNNNIVYAFLSCFFSDYIKIVKLYIF